MSRTGGFRCWERLELGAACALFWGVLLVIACGLGSAPAQALDAYPVSGSEDRVELTEKGVALGGRGDRLQIDTAPGADGISRRMSVNATTAGTNPNWMVFALSNMTDKVVVRWITIQRYSLIGSGVIWPDLDSRRMAALTPSVGFLPQRIQNDRADIFRIEIEPGQTVTYAAEMASARLSRIYMWKPLAYELHVRESRLFNGIMLGITGLLGIFLTAVFAANHKAIFPSAALVTWCVLIYLCVDFGFWHKLLQISSEDNAVYRAASEAAMATSIAIFLHTFLRLGSWHGFARMLSSVWIIAQLVLVFIAILDPRLASTFARLSFAALGGVGALLILFLAVRGQDRALSIIPTWLLFLVWLFGVAMTLTGKLNGDIVVSALVAGLVLITVLIGFTVTQFAFRSIEPHYGAAPSEQQLRSLAVEGAGAAVWEWHARRSEIKVGGNVEVALGLNLGELSTKVKDFIRYMHPADQERFNVLLWTLQNKGSGEIRTDFRMRHADNSYRWFDLEAASVATSDRRSLRCVGLLRDVTDQKRSQARLMQDAVVDSLTGLPNRELLQDRIKTAVARTASEALLRPTVLLIDLDQFKGVNSSFGLIVGDSLLLTISRRLARHLQPMDTLARLGGDRFAMLVLSVSDPEELARLAESIRRSLRAPIKIAGQDIVLSGTIGMAVHDRESGDELDILKDAEVAMYRAKRHGADQIEIFKPEMRDERDDRAALEEDLRRALERRQIKVHYQPIIYLPTEELAGFEALVRWEHPKLGLLNPQDYVSGDEDNDLNVKLGSYVFSEAVAKTVEWQKKLPRARHPLFVSVNIANRQLFRQDLIQEIRHVLSQVVVPDNVLRLEIAESLVMENPERAAEILDMLKGTGVGLALDDFGTGYSSLAYLERFPFDTIKIDRHIVQASGDGQGSGATLVRSIVAMAKELNKKIVAEGVETSQDIGLLRSIGCQYAQGFYYGEPMGERDVTDLLKIVHKSERKHQRRGIFGGALGRKEKDSERPERGNQPASGSAPSTITESEVLDHAGNTGKRDAMLDGSRHGNGALPPVVAKGAGPGNYGMGVGPSGRPAGRPDSFAPPGMDNPAMGGNSPGGRAYPNGGVPAQPQQAGPAAFARTGPTSQSGPSPISHSGAGDVPPTIPRRMPPPHWRHAPRTADPDGVVDGAAANDAGPADERRQPMTPHSGGLSEPPQPPMTAEPRQPQRPPQPAGLSDVSTPPQDALTGQVSDPRPPMPRNRDVQLPTASSLSDEVQGSPRAVEGEAVSEPDPTSAMHAGDLAQRHAALSDLPAESIVEPVEISASAVAQDRVEPPISVRDDAPSPDAPPPGLGDTGAPDPDQRPPVLPTLQDRDAGGPSLERRQPDNGDEFVDKGKVASPPAEADFSTLPPGIAQSLARLAGVPAPPANDKEPIGGGEPDEAPDRRRQKKVEAGE